MLWEHERRKISSVKLKHAFTLCCLIAGKSNISERLPILDLLEGSALKKE